jgi:hypothetical protein
MIEQATAHQGRNRGSRQGSPLWSSPCQLGAESIASDWFLAEGEVWINERVPPPSFTDADRLHRGRTGSFVEQRSGRLSRESKDWGSLAGDMDLEAEPGQAMVDRKIS